MALVVLVFEVGIERKQLARRQHTLVDQYPGVQAAHVNQVFGVADFGCANESFARQVKRVIQYVVVGGVITDNGLLYKGHGSECRRPYVGPDRADRHFAEPDQGEALVGQCVMKRGLQFFPPGFILRQEHIANRIVARVRQLNTKFGGDLLHKLVGNGCHDAGAIAGILFKAAAAAVVHP